MGAVNTGTVPANEASLWMSEYFRRKRLKGLGLTTDASSITEYEQEVLLYIDSQMDVQREKKSKRDSRKSRGKR